MAAAAALTGGLTGEQAENAVWNGVEEDLIGAGGWRLKNAAF